MTDDDFKKTFSVFKNTSDDPLSNLYFSPSVTIELSQRSDLTFHADSLMLIKKLRGTIYRPNLSGTIYITGKSPTPNEGTDFWTFVATEQIKLILKICDKREENSSVYTNILPSHAGKNFNINFYKITRLPINFNNLTTTNVEYSINETKKHSVIYAVYNDWSFGSVPNDHENFIKIYLTLKKIAKTQKTYVFSMNGEGRANLFSCISHYYDFVTKKLVTDPLTLLCSLRVDNKIPLQTDIQYAFLYICVGELMIQNHLTKKNLMISNVIEKYWKYRNSINLSNVKKSCKDKNVNGTPEAWWIDFLSNDVWVYSTYLSIDYRRDLATVQGHFFNMKKSRSKNNYCYDTTRIILLRNHCKKRDNAKTFDNFYNANWITHPKITQKYILGESPCSDSIEDFVELIYQEKVPLLFTPDYNIKNIFEFLPLQKGQSKYYGIYKLTCIYEYLPMNLDGCYIIKFVIKCSGSTYEHEFDQIQYRRWGNKQIPADYVFLPLLIQLTMSLDKANPILVHCRDGWSNSGTFVMAHYMVNRLLVEPTLKPKDMLKEIRNQRYSVGCIPHQVLYALLSIGEVLIKMKVLKNTTTKNDHNKARYLYDEFAKKLLRRPQHFNHFGSDKMYLK
uniref:Tyrosine-protein phosphatase domain-containing protein n=1 Tax=Strongyloides papillosus TaxID=174720 RepID=A0A0N5BLS5_STREA